MKASQAIGETLNDLEGSEFTHDPEATRYGIVQTEYDHYRKSKGLTQRSVELIDLDESIEIYNTRYWTPLKCSQMPDGVDFVMFQMGVNIGNGRAVEILQNIVGATADGHIGPKTLAAAKAFGPDLVSRLLDGQEAYYNQITASNPERNSKYISGWHNRIRKVKIYLATGLTESGAVAAGSLGIVGLALIFFLLIKMVMK